MAKTLVEAECQECGKLFMVEPSRFRHGRGKTCSRECQYKVTGRKAVERLTGKKVDSAWETRCCPVCAKQFTVTLSHPSVHCSIACGHASPQYRKRISDALKSSERAKAQRSKVLAALKQSNTTENRSARTTAAWQNPETRRRLMEGIKRRSSDPVWLSATHFQTGQDHPRYKGNSRARREGISRYRYKEWRKAVYQRDNYTCQDCNTTGCYLNAHHIKPWSESPELRYEVDNGVTLCTICHDKRHGHSHRARHAKCIDCKKPKTRNRSPRCHPCAIKHMHAS